MKLRFLFLCILTICVASVSLTPAKASVIYTPKAAEQQLKRVQEQTERVKKQIEQIDLKMNQIAKQTTDLQNKITALNTEIHELQNQLDLANRVSDSQTQQLANRIVLLYFLLNDEMWQWTMSQEWQQTLWYFYLILEHDVKKYKTSRATKEQLEQIKTKKDQLLNEMNQLNSNLLVLERDLQVQHQQKQQLLKYLQERMGYLEEIAEHESNAMMVVISNQLRQINYRPSHGLSWVWPLDTKGILTSYFGFRTDPITKKRSYHDGIDIAAPEGTPIRAANDGVVIFAGYMSGFGNTVCIYHADGLVTLYGHIRHGGIHVQKGDKVSAGQIIAEVGSTGRSTGNHLHFSIYKGQQKLDPLSYVAIPN